ncbi:HAMP domain-containing histidine kinase [Streptococcus oralis]|uniref:histidine kinase n=1 Tax=Streptococcus jiangnanensis TaxID=3095079 RepID=A0ABU5G5M5_9STRE|nr:MULTISPECIES: HAMP domain-containing sensor histidine kinase [Streptococcus]AQA09135.1 his Kinase A domain protein [Streptococcus oralis]MCP9037134.1 HAMP domain-containing histidine kinase [Streptococcus oralis]MCP9052240.1 HAMP domain-containing histidine kinase [Streptococcus oralis]MCP9058364.1 HAMP domain-containing histidine kinase [Streptococcus oralis]MCP9066189.1 HAMP domain-containing histidine kinase [Streptococcus oralis]
MNYILISILLLTNIILAISLIRYHIAIKDLSRQIEEKIRSGSMKRIGVNFFSKTILRLHNQIENLFQEVEQNQLIMKREKRTLDMAISNIAHDIRTPLTIASGYTQQLIKHPDNSSETLNKIAHHQDLVSKRLEALLEYRHLMEGAVKPKLEELDLSTFITKKTLAYYDVFQSSHIVLDFNVEPGLKTTTDEDLLDRIIQNLLGNVLKHGKEKARLSLKKEENRLVLEIDNLVKKPIKNIDNLSNRFYSENMSDTEESSGLGLYITEELVHLLGSEMKLSTDDQWLSVFIYF